VLVIGIGTYDHLVGGVQVDDEIAEGMEQLPSAATSARAITDWFLGGSFNNSEKPLASLGIVVSEDQVGRYEHAGATKTGHDLPTGTAAAVEMAIEKWLERASSHPDNLAIFYFSGHGIFAGNSVLLCRDYGARRQNRFDGAINFNNLVEAMATKTPTFQVFLADACRTPDSVSNMLTEFKGAGRSAIAPSPSTERGGTLARQSVHLASSPFTQSWARAEGLTIYADALIRALSGGGAQIDMGMWVGTEGLQNALATYTARMAQREGVEQEPDRTKSARFKVHRPVRVDVPVYLTCEPTDVWSFSFTVEARAGQAVACHLKHDPADDRDRSELEIMLPCDKYEVSASFSDEAPYQHFIGSVLAFPPEAPLCLPFVRKV
jgi:hypothetical protein